MLLQSCNSLISFADRFSDHTRLLLVKSDAFRNRGSPQLASAVTAEITQNINSPGTGSDKSLTLHPLLADFTKPLGEDSTPATVKPLRVSLVQPVAYPLSYLTTRGSEEQPQAELHKPLIHRRGEYLALGGIAHRRVRGGEVRVIERVEHVDSELQVETFRDFELLEEGRIELLHAIAVQWIDARVSIGIGDEIIDEAARIEPRVWRWIGYRAVADPVRPVVLPVVQEAYRGVNVEARSAGYVDEPGIAPPT
jgi:hypothetical protein